MRKGAKVRTRHEVVLAAFYKRHKGGKGALNRRDRKDSHQRRRPESDSSREIQTVNRSFKNHP
jgi:hypothetical protein